MIEMKKNEQLYTMLRQDPITNPMELVKDVVESYRPEQTPDKYINPQINELIQAFMEFPEIGEIVGQFLQQKQLEEQAQEGGERRAQ